MRRLRNQVDVHSYPMKTFTPTVRRHPSQRHRSKPIPFIARPPTFRPEIIPLKDRVLIELMEEKRSGLIVLPETAKERPTEGKILKLGIGPIDKKDADAMGLRVGDHLVISKYGHTEVADRSKLMIVSHGDIVAVVRWGMLLPVGNFVLVRPIPFAETMIGRFHIPATLNKKTTRGEIIALGTTGFFDELFVGDKVLYGEAIRTDIGIGGVNHSIVRVKNLITQL